MTEHESLTLRSVTERFAASSEVLDQLRDRLERLTTAEAAQARASASLDGSASELRRLIGEVQNVVQQLSAAQSITQDALDAARTALQASDVTALIGEIQVLRNDVRGLHALGASAQAATDEARREAARATAALADLQARVAQVPERARRRAGLA